MPYPINPFTGELDRIADTSGFADTFTTDSGDAVPVGGVIIIAGGLSIDTSGAGNTVTIDFDVTESPDLANSFLTDSGSAVPALNVLTVAGGNGISTSGAGSTVTIDLDSPVTVPNGGTGLTSLLDHSVLVGSGVASITELVVGTDGQILLGATAADPSFGTPTSSDNLLSFTLGAGSLDIVAQNAVAAAAVLDDNAVVTGDGGVRGVQTSTVLVSAAGEMTNPSQPAFFARNNTTQSNFTGTGTTYIVRYQNTTLDVGGDYDGTDTFTAPVDGKYSFSATVQLISLAASATATQLSMDSSTINRRASVVNGENVRSGSSNTLLLNGQLFIDLDAADICQITIQVSGMPGDTVDLSSTTGNTFAGYLVF